MDNCTIRQILENAHLLLQQLPDFLSLQEVLFGLFLLHINANIQNCLGENRKEDVVDEELLVLVEHVDSLHRAIDEHLETHLQPIDIHEQKA